jgi:hypothetical protein
MNANCYLTKIESVLVYFLIILSAPRSAFQPYGPLGIPGFGA